MFFIFPLTMFGLSLAGGPVVITATVLIVSLLVFAVSVTQLQRNRPHSLPSCLRTSGLCPWGLEELSSTLGSSGPWQTALEDGCVVSIR